MVKILESEADFALHIANNKFALVDFFSTECPPCEKLAPIYERLAAKYPKVAFAKIYRQGNRALAERIGVSGSPTVLFFKDDELQEKRLSGDISEIDFENLISDLTDNEFLASSNDSAVIQKRDLCIIGTGPAGLSASIYAARYKVDQIMVGELPGGLMTSSHKICNYPSEMEISGMDLTEKMSAHVKQLEVPSLTGSVVSISKASNGFEVLLSSKEKILAKTVLLATGTKHRHLGLPNEKELVGKGISYCATCDGMFYANKKVAVIGGSDSATTAALYLANVADTVYQIYRGDELRGETAWIDLAKQNPKIMIIYNTDVKKIVGEKKLERIELSKPFKNNNSLEINGMFVEVGSEPDNTIFKDLRLKTDEKGYILTAADQGTSERGLWAAGDITTGSNGFRQIITACSEGAIAAQSVFTYLQKNINK